MCHVRSRFGKKLHEWAAVDFFTNLHIACNSVHDFPLAEHGKQVASKVAEPMKVSCKDRRTGRWMRSISASLSDS